MNINLIKRAFEISKVIMVKPYKMTKDNILIKCNFDSYTELLIDDVLFMRILYTIKNKTSSINDGINRIRFYAEDDEEIYHTAP